MLQSIATQGWRRIAHAALGLGMATFLSACGGGGGSAGDSVFPGGGTGTGGGGATISKVADVSLVSDVVTLPNNGTQVAAITATTLDSARTALGSMPLVFSVEDPAGSAFVIAEGGAATTNSTTGQLRGTVSLGSNRSNRTIKVLATSGSVVRSVSLDVIDSAAVTPTAADMTISLSKVSVGNSNSETVGVVVTAVDGSRNAVAGIDVTFTVDANAVVVVNNGKTLADGTARASVSNGGDRSNRLVTVTAKSGTLTRQASFRITGAKLQGSPVPATLKIGEAGQIQYTLVDVNGSAMAAVPITVTWPNNVVAAKTGTTDERGQYLYTYTAVGSGPTTISAQGGGSTTTSTVQIDAQLSDVPAGTNIASATFTVSPSVVNVNAVGSRDNRSDLRLLFLTDKNQPVPNVRVRLGLGANQAGTDGNIGSGNDAVITADANGIAVSSFVAGQRASATDQVKVYACYSKTDNVESINACPDSRKLQVSLTVVEQPVSISIGTDNTIADGANTLTYVQRFTVLVVDAAGNPKADVQLSPVVDLPSYLKGFWDYDETDKVWKQVVTASCVNEDSSVEGFRNGTIEAFNGVSEDINGSGQLDPRKSDVSIAMVGSTRTDVNGQAVLRIEYPKSYGSWTEFSIRVSASGVVSPPAWFGRIANPGAALGTLTGNREIIGVPVDVVKQEGRPPFVTSPYGTVPSCLNPS